jgi:DNA-binding NarL/FixJ family response regulator
MKAMSFADPNTTILLIDNNDTDRAYYANQLKLSSPECVVLEAKDGQAGLDLFRSQKIDCIVTDYNLPDMSSFQLLFDVNPAEGVPEMAIIVLARYAIPKIADLAKRYGAHSFLMKRLTSGEELTNVIQKAIAAVVLRRKERGALIRCWPIIREIR